MSLMVIDKVNFQQGREEEDIRKEKEEREGKKGRHVLTGKRRKREREIDRKKSEIKE